MTLLENYKKWVRNRYLKNLDRRNTSLIDERRFGEELNSSRLPQQLVIGDIFFFKIRSIINELMKNYAISSKSAISLSKLLENENLINTHTRTYIDMKIIEHNSKGLLFLNVPRIIWIFFIQFIAVIAVYGFFAVLGQLSPEDLDVGLMTMPNIFLSLGVIYLLIQSRTLLFLVYYGRKYRSSGT